ncbi:hypothetical protein NEF87_005100 [Candidatus Lokiarchaeum ossiferum]|uniref:Uncharacterized protein n=1 Tax=Candidatus Lokiarchaeum ossiferum TaxID=2951803 RepID=A0ABY6HZH7_9ARCH|nr:hypothetical protein NEF87_005100 [Candidatus Lokiarchaeum sp. B-35]
MKNKKIVLILALGFLMIPILPQNDLSLVSAEVGDADGDWEVTYSTNDAATIVNVANEGDITEIYALTAGTSDVSWFYYTGTGLGEENFYFQCSLKFGDGLRKQLYVFLEDGDYFIIRFESDWISTYTYDDLVMENQAQNLKYNTNQWYTFQLRVTQSSTTTKELMMYLDDGALNTPVTLESSSDIRDFAMRTMRAQSTIYVADNQVDFKSLSGTGSVSYLESDISKLTSTGTTWSYFEYKERNLEMSRNVLQFECDIKFTVKQTTFLRFYFGNNKALLIKFEPQYSKIRLHDGTIYHDVNSVNTQFGGFQANTDHHLVVKIVQQNSGQKLWRTYWNGHLLGGLSLYINSPDTEIFTSMLLGMYKSNIWYVGNLEFDNDQDGLVDQDEDMIGTDPLNPDTDGDGYSDYFEANTAGYNPLVYYNPTVFDPINDVGSISLENYGSGINNVAVLQSPSTSGASFTYNAYENPNRMLYLSCDLQFSDDNVKIIHVAFADGKYVLLKIEPALGKIRMFDGTKYLDKTGLDIYDSNTPNVYHHLEIEIIPNSPINKFMKTTWDGELVRYGWIRSLAMITEIKAWIYDGGRTWKIANFAVEQTDSDLDGLLDRFEEDTGLNIGGVNPLDWDDDGISDADEIYSSFGYKTDPKNDDSDGDRLEDGEEVDLGTDPTEADSDGDEFSDGEEILTYLTNPLDSMDPFGDHFDKDVNGDSLNSWTIEEDTDCAATIINAPSWTNRPGKVVRLIDESYGLFGGNVEIEKSKNIPENAPVLFSVEVGLETNVNNQYAYIEILDEDGHEQKKIRLGENRLDVDISGLAIPNWDHRADIDVGKMYQIDFLFYWHDTNIQRCKIYLNSVLIAGPMNIKDNTDIPSGIRITTKSISHSSAYSVYIDNVKIDTCDENVEVEILEDQEIPLFISRIYAPSGEESWQKLTITETISTKISLEVAIGKKWGSELDYLEVVLDIGTTSEDNYETELSWTANQATGDIILIKNYKGSVKATGFKFASANQLHYIQETTFIESESPGYVGLTELSYSLEYPFSEVPNPIISQPTIDNFEWKYPAGAASTYSHTIKKTTEVYGGATIDLHLSGYSIHIRPKISYATSYSMKSEIYFYDANNPIDTRIYLFENEDTSYINNVAVYTG